MLTVSTFARKGIASGSMCMTVTRHTVAIVQCMVDSSMSGITRLARQSSVPRWTVTFLHRGHSDQFLG